MEDPNQLIRFIELLPNSNKHGKHNYFGPEVQESARILLSHDMGHVLGQMHPGKRGPYMRRL